MVRDKSWFTQVHNVTAGEESVEINTFINQISLKDMTRKTCPKNINYNPPEEDGVKSTI